MGRIESCEYDSVTCDNQCGAKTEVAPGGIPAGLWRHGQVTEGYDGGRFDACTPACASAIGKRLAAEADNEVNMTWWRADGVTITVRTHRKDP